MDMLVSVVVPIYKVEKYINKCIDSIINQTYKNLEIILVDDGSPDRCPQICDEYAKKDNRIKVIHKKNSGLGAARNTGIDAAKGEYIGFVDSDDWIMPNMYEEMLYCCENYQVAICECTISFIDEKGKEINVITSDYQEMNKQNVLTNLFTYKINMNAAWNKLYKRHLFENIRYVEGKLYEDLSTTYKLIHKTDKIFYTNNTKYFYYQSPNSILRNNSKIVTADLLEFTEDVLEFVYFNYKNIFEECMCSQLTYTFEYFRKILVTDFSFRNEFHLQYVNNLEKLYKKYRKSILKNKEFRLKTKISILIISYNSNIEKNIYKFFKRIY